MIDFVVSASLRSAGTIGLVAKGPMWPRPERYLDSDLNVVLRVGRSSRKNVAVIRGLRPHEFVEFGRYGYEKWD